MMAELSWYFQKVRTWSHQVLCDYHVLSCLFFLLFCHANDYVASLNPNWKINFQKIRVLENQVYPIFSHSSLFFLVRRLPAFESTHFLQMEEKLSEKLSGFPEGALSEFCWHCETKNFDQDQYYPFCAYQKVSCKKFKNPKIQLFYDNLLYVLKIPETYMTRIFVIHLVQIPRYFEGQIPFLFNFCTSQAVLDIIFRKS